MDRLRTYKHKSFVGVIFVAIVLYMNFSYSTYRTEHSLDQWLFVNKFIYVYLANIWVYFSYQNVMGQKRISHFVRLRYSEIEYTKYLIVNSLLNASLYMTIVMIPLVALNFLYIYSFKLLLAFIVLFALSNIVGSLFEVYLILEDSVAGLILLIVVFNLFIRFGLIEFIMKVL